MVRIDMTSAVLELAVAEYLCRHRSVGIFRLVEDVLRRPDVRLALGLRAPPAPGTDEWWKVYHEIIEAVRALEIEGLVRYVSSVGVVNWLVSICL